MNAERLIREHYIQIRSNLPDLPLAVLHIGNEQTAVACGSGSSAPDTALLNIGARKTASNHFRRHPPAPVEMENAIAAVEDEVMRIRNTLPHGARLVSPDPAIRLIARMAGITENVMPIDAIEQVFSRLAAVSLGRPARQEEASLSPEFYATVLIAREFMHHLGFISITIREAN